MLYNFHFNIEAENKVMKDFCIDLLITNSKFSFLKTNPFETGLSDHMIFPIHKTKFEKFEPKKLIYRNFKQYNSEQIKLNNFNSMSAIRTMQPLKIIFFQF